MKNISQNKKIAAACYGFSVMNCIVIWVSKQLRSLPAYSYNVGGQGWGTSMGIAAICFATGVIWSLAGRRISY